MMKEFFTVTGAFLGRFCISMLFIFAALLKLLNYTATLQGMEAKGLSMLPWLLFLLILIEFVAGCALLMSWNVRLAAFMLMLLLVPITYYYHDFWNVTGATQKTEMQMFLKNLAIFGGLLYILIFATGKSKENSKVKPIQEKSEPPPEN